MLVKVAGFAPATPWSQAKCSTELSYTLILSDNLPKTSDVPHPKFHVGLSLMIDWCFQQKSNLQPFG